MSLAHPPLLELHGLFPGFSYRPSDRVWCDMYAAHDVRTYATACVLDAINADRAARIPMTVMQITEAIRFWRDDRRRARELVRVVEAHHNIGKP